MQKKIRGKRLDNVIATMFDKHGNRRQFNVMDLGKISAAGRSAYDAAAAHEDGLTAADKAVAEACDRFEIRPKAPRRPAPTPEHPDPCVAASLAEAAADAPPAEGDLDFSIPGL